MVGHLFVAFLCAMTLLSSLDIRKLTHWLFPIYVHSERVGSSVFHFFQWMRTFLYYDPDRFACVRIPTQIQIQHYNTNLNSHMHPSVHTTLGLLHFISFQYPQYYFYSGSALSRAPQWPGRSTNASTWSLWVWLWMCTFHRHVGSSWRTWARLRSLAS